MTAQTGIFNILSTDPELATLLEVPVALLSEKVLRAGKKDIPDLCLVVRWEGDALTSPIALAQFTLRAHERSESYMKIDALLDRAKALLTAVVHQQGIAQVDWRGRSPDLIDDGYRTLVRYDTYFVAAGLKVREEV